jgi:Lar family restriction alleviation protein
MSEETVTPKPEPTKVKPCPFCGQTPDVIRETILNFPTGKFHTHFVKCKRLKCRVKPSVQHRSLAEVLEIWNGRA